MLRLLIPEFTPYRATFMISGPLDPTQEYGFRCWYPEGVPFTLRRLLAVGQLNRYVARGEFNEAGVYIFMMCQDGFIIRYGLFKTGAVL